LDRIPPDLRSSTSYLRSTTSNLGPSTTKWRSSTLMLRSTAIQLNVKSHRSVGSQYKADHCECKHVSKQKLLNNRCVRDKCSAYMHWRNMVHHIFLQIYGFKLTGSRVRIRCKKIGVGFHTFMGVSYSQPNG